MAVAEERAIDPNASIVTSASEPAPVATFVTSSRSISTTSSIATRPNWHDLVQRLERRADEISVDGSDVAEQIRRLNDNYKRRHCDDSSSIWTQLDEEGERETDEERARIPEVLHTSTKWPVRSLSSLSGSSRNGSTPTRGSFQTSPIPNSSQFNNMDESTRAVQPLVLSPSIEPERTSLAGSESSLDRRYDQIAAEVQESLDNMASPPLEEVGVYQPGLEIPRQDGRMPSDRPPSTDTFLEAQDAFQDFDGVHFDPETDQLVHVDENGHEIRRVSARSSSGRLSAQAASLLQTPRQTQDRVSSQRLPSDRSGMVFYPAPVPRMLNLPKRLSQLPAANVQSKRRTQVLSQYGPEVRQSAPWLADSKTVIADSKAQRLESEPEAEVPPRTMLNERLSVANFNNLPPQLRAGVFFDHQTVVQDVRVQSESAVATLDSILQASATAPVNAFLDHPYAGDVRKSVFAAEARIARADAMRERALKHRESGMGRLLRRASSHDMLGGVLEEDDEGGYTRRKSLMNLAGHLGLGHGTTEHEIDEILDADGYNAEGVRVANTTKPRELTEAEQIEEDFRREEMIDEADEGGDDAFAQPSTLLAELQVRKAQQKSRSRTAATAFPNGMHSTLLQMDAVEEVNRNRRKNNRVLLAWEDPALHIASQDDETEDVPLGMLYPGNHSSNNRKTGDYRDWDRSVGLMEQRQFEDTEPLSSRRNRLKGIPPPRPVPTHSASQGPSSNADPEPEDEHADESLGQRQRRLRTKNALDAAISDVASHAEGTVAHHAFGDDLLAQFGGVEPKSDESADKTNEATKSDDPGEGETLGQRRARLNREASSAAAVGQTPRPALATRNSMASLLASHPAGLRSTSREHVPSQGSLLHANEQAQNRHRQHILDTNGRASSLSVHRLAIQPRFPSESPYSTAPVSAQSFQQPYHIPNGLTNFNNPMPGLPFAPAGAGLNGASTYFASPTTGNMQFGAFGNGPAGYLPMAHPQQQPMYSSPLQQLQLQQLQLQQQQFQQQYYPTAGQSYMNPGMGMGMGMAGQYPSDASTLPGQREKIMLWRQDIA